MARRKHKPKSPEQIALDRATARAAEKAADARGEFGIDLTTHALPQNAEVISITDKAGKIQTARRGDVFDRLLNNDQLRAVRRLEADIAEQRGETWRPGQRVTVDASQFPPGQNLSQMQIDAGKRVNSALTACGHSCGWLLRDLITRAEIGYPSKTGEGDKVRPLTPEERAERGASFDWRRVVYYITGETNEQAQGARVRAAADNLSAAYGTAERARVLERA